MKILSIVGARPQFIKLAPLSLALREDHEEIIVHTGQHYDYSMSGQIFEDLSIRQPDFHLGVGSGSHALQTAEMMKLLEPVLLDTNPNLVIVFGDTNSTLAGALTASKINIPLLHIEAGLRSFNRKMPEELNRVVTDHVSDYLFAPTTSAMHHLEREGLIEKTWLSGDIMVDTIKNNLQAALIKSQALDILSIEPGKYNLLTLHRNYNVDQPKILYNILNQLGQLNELVIFPVHPRTKKMLTSLDKIPPNIKLTEPLSYLDFINLEHHSKRIITDSGGIQKEAYILQRPCITLRTETEWVETVEEKWNLLISPLCDNMFELIADFKTPHTQNPIFGENVTEKMISIINRLL